MTLGARHIVLFIIFAGGVALAYQQFISPQKQVLTPVKNQELLLSPTDLVTVHAESFDKSVAFNGALKPWQQALLNAQVSAEVKEVKVKAGQAVEAGEVLLELDTRDIDLRYQQAMSALQSKKLELEQMQQQLDQVKQLRQQEYASKTDLDSAKRQRDITAAQVESAQAAVEQIQQQQQNAIVVAPFAGRIAERFIDKGQLVSAGTPLLKIIEVARLELEALVSASEASSISAGQSVQFSVSGEAYSYTGLVKRINPQARSENRRVPVYIEVDNTSERLVAGMFVQGRIKNNREIVGLSVPISAMQESAEGWQVVMLEHDLLVPVAVDLLVKDPQQGKALVRSSGAHTLIVNSQILAAPNEYALQGRQVKISQVN